MMAFEGWKSEVFFVLAVVTHCFCEAPVRLAKMSPWWKPIARVLELYARAPSWML